MNKLFVAIVAISAVGGLVALLYFHVNPLTTIQQLISAPETILPAIWDFLKDKVYYLIGIAGTAITTILAVAKRVSDIRSKGEETVETLRTQFSEEKVEWQTKLSTAEATLAQREKEFAEKFNTQAEIITTTQQQANQAFQYREERDTAIRELNDLRTEIAELRKKYIVA